MLRVSSDAYQRAPADLPSRVTGSAIWRVITATRTSMPTRVGLLIPGYVGGSGSAPTRSIIKRETRSVIGSLLIVICLYGHYPGTIHRSSISSYRTPRGTAVGSV